MVSNKISDSTLDPKTLLDDEWIAGKSPPGGGSKIVLKRLLRFFCRSWLWSLFRRFCNDFNRFSNGFFDRFGQPLLHRWAEATPTIRLRGPLPPDTCWLSAAQAWSRNNSPGPDGILALYHDQGLIPVKLLAFDQAVNTTLGLSFLRTSPDHGTGFDIAGQGIARCDSMLSAIAAAWTLSQA